MIVTRTLAAAAIAFLAISGATAPAEASAYSNGISINGISINGLSLNGLSLNAYVRNGLTMNGAHLNGASAVAPRIVGVELPPAR